MNLVPLGSRIIIKKLKNERQHAGIILTDEQDTPYGGIVAVGEVSTLKVGDKVLYSEFHATPIKDGDEEYIIVSESAVLLKKGDTNG